MDTSNSIIKQTVVISLIGFFVGIISGSVYSSLSLNLPIHITSPLGEITSNPPLKKEIIGFLPYWLIQKAKDSYAKEITTLAYFSLTISPNGMIQKLINNREEEPGWTTLKKQQVREYLKRAKQEGLKTSLVIFSGNENHIDELMTNPVEHATNLLNDIEPIMREYEFDDLNIDIESLVEASASSQQEFTSFVKTVTDGMNTRSLGTVSLDTTVTTLFEEQRINTKDISALVDRIILMTYDYHYAGSQLAGPVAPLGGAGTHRFNDVETSIKAALQYIPPEKLLLGIPFYGYEWETMSSVPGSPVIPGTGQTASDSRAITTIQSCSTCISGRDVVSNAPYIIFPEGEIYRQIFYTDEKTMEHTLELTKKLNIRGGAVWALGYEAERTMTPFEPYLLK